MARREPFAVKTNQKAIRAAMRSQQALQLRVQGYSFAQIAEQLGYKTKYAAWHAVYRALQKLPAKNAELLRDIELERTDVALRALYPKVIDGDCNAIKRWTEVIELRCRILGLFAPTKVEHGVVDDAQDPLFRFLDALAERVEASHVESAGILPARGTSEDTT
ncbi:MAG: hypothetical protein KatS3mg023_3903 [Armatimonadota bacterium]|nr:MAG: hypothetical protein KatS3mg023_3903 [Armatimonadota bacterium]